jgi:hypothetical protein
MAAKKEKGSYISLELEWMTKKVTQLQAAIDNYDLLNLKDRVENKQTKNGGIIPMVIASKEDQLKSIAMIMEKLPKMLQALDELRQKEDEIKQTKVRGAQELTPLEGGDL